MTSLALSRLDQREAARVVAGVAGNKPLPAGIVDQIVGRADGIPLFVEEVTKAVLESGLLHEQDERYVIEGPLPPVAIPSSLYASLMARLDRLSPVKEVAQIGAAVGRRFSYELIAALARRTDEQLRDALQQLVSSGLVFCRGTPPQEFFIFKHALVQDAAYSSLLRPQRQELHARIAKVLETRFAETATTQPEILAHHYTQAGLSDTAIDYWRRAGDLALRRSANVEGVTHLTHAIQLIQSLPATRDRDRRELDLHLALGQMMRATKGYAAPETLRVFVRARELLGGGATVNEQKTVLYGLWSVHYVRAEHVAARGVAQQCLALAAEHQDTDVPALANMLMGCSLLAMGAFNDGRQHLEQTQKLAASGDRFLAPRGKRRWVEETEERLFAAELHRLRGGVLLELGNHCKGEAELLRALAIARERFPGKSAPSARRRRLGVRRNSDTIRIARSNRPRLASSSPMLA